MSADIIAEKSVDQTCDKHYRRIVRALQLVYEALPRNVIRNGMSVGLTLSEDVLELLDKVRNASECIIS